MIIFKKEKHGKYNYSRLKSKIDFPVQTTNKLKAKIRENYETQWNFKKIKFKLCLNNSSCHNLDFSQA